MLMKAITSFVSRVTGRRLTVLTFHNIRPVGEALAKDEIDAEQFDQRLTWLGELVRIFPLEDALRVVKSGRGPDHIAAITFDDGYTSNLHIALPVLLKHNIQATFFVLPGLLGGSLWTEDVRDAVRNCKMPVLSLGDLGGAEFDLNTEERRREAGDSIVEWMKSLPDGRRRSAVDEVFLRTGYSPKGQQLMNESEIRQLAAAGMEIGSHSLTHPMLSRVEDEIARKEITKSRYMIGDLTGRPARYFAYPNGRPSVDFALRDMNLVREAGYEAAFSTGWSAISAQSIDFELPRFTPWDETAWRFQGRLLENILRKPAVLT